MGVGGITPDSILQVVRQSLQGEQDKIDASRDEVTALEDRRLAITNVDNILEQLRTSLFNFTQPNLLLQRTVSTSDSNVAVASATNDAPSTSYTFSTISQLAEAARVTSGAGLGLSAATGPFAASTADVNGGATPDYDENSAITVSQGLSPEISAGTFTINGVEITVVDGDTLMTILTKINNSGANVEASFNNFTDEVRLSGTLTGADETITFDNGTSNFFDAVNITGQTSGSDAQADQALDNGPLSAVTPGYFTINNFTFFVDPATESLNDVISKVNRSNAGVTIFFDQDSNRVTIQNKEEGKDLLLSNDSSGFLSAIGVRNLAGDTDPSVENSEYAFTQASFTLNGEALTKDTNTFTINGVTFSLIGETATDVTVTVNQDLDKTVTQVNDFVAQFNASISRLQSELDQEDGPLEGDLTLRQIRLDLLNDILGQISNPGEFDSLADIGFKIEASGNGDFTLTVDADRLRSQLQDDELSVQRLFAFDNDGDGLFDEGGYAIATRSFIEQFTRSVSGIFDNRKDDLDAFILDRNLSIDNQEQRLLTLEERRFDEFVQQIVELQRLQAQQQRVAQTGNVLLQSILS